MSNAPPHVVSMSGKATRTPGDLHARVNPTRARVNIVGRNTSQWRKAKKDERHGEGTVPGGH